MLTIIPHSELTLAETAEQWLQQLPGPVMIEVPGKDRTRCRIVSTLIHGNEPSGFYAVHRYLLENHTPATDLAISIASVRAARLPPMHRHRFVPGEYDLNRRFGKLKAQDKVTELAHQLTEYIRNRCPTAVVDLHNTSGASPAFAVSINEHEKVLKVAALFTENMIVTQLNVGALMEQNFNCPVVTIECGGANDPRSHEAAYQGLLKFLNNDRLDSLATKPIQLYHHPVRVSIQPNLSLTYAKQPDPNFDITLVPDIEQLNFTGLTAKQCFGWSRRPLEQTFEAIGDDGHDCLSDLFHQQEQALYANANLKCFMATMRADIALNDCLFYILKTK